MNEKGVDVPLLGRLGLVPLQSHTLSDLLPGNGVDRDTFFI